MNDDKIQAAIIDRRRCTDCALCEDICGRRVFETRDEAVVIARPEACNGCGDCIEICPVDAIVMSCDS